MIHLNKALQRLGFTSEDYKLEQHDLSQDPVIVWKSSQPQPSESELQTASDEWQAEYDAQEYARNRAMEYPSIDELVVALYDTEDKAAIDEKRAAVKAKYPKS